MAVAPDGTLYVADTGNHRIQHLAPDGRCCRSGAASRDAASGRRPAAPSTSPGACRGPDGSVYVADTWNHRIQKFSPQGEFVKTWGFFGQAEPPFALWGPRDVAVDPGAGAGDRYRQQARGGLRPGRQFPYSSSGRRVWRRASSTSRSGSLSTPDDRAYVVDTWNQRVQVFQKRRMAPTRS